uniref:Uncharacterized protein n=1 Tax=Trieres chinensis TaxID=1514140 RepID=A0A7S2EFH4_TRICV|mmetsp:Transcript_20528/g.41576  ORF Transcript_20528/g.41576 Transcript_20528/m.41576 type:complete len:151 (+) Transcript_20528:3-455(+)
MEDEASGDIGSESQSREESVNGTASWDGDCRGKDDIDLRFISDQDRESLKVAMSMMSSEELEELKRNSPYSDVRNWMLRSNYESLKEASAQLEKQAMRKKLSSAQGTSLSSSSTQSSEARRTASNAKLSQALAMLVLRKNLLKTKTPQAS